MLKEKLLFIINPISGARSKAGLPGIIKNGIDKNKFEVEISFSNERGHASQITRDAINGGTKKIIAVGGDGTINEVAKEMVNKDVILGIMPEGSGNGLARHMKIPVDASRAVKIINAGKTLCIDSGMVNGHPFFCTSGVGFDAHIGELFADRTKRGFASYISTTLGEYMSYQPTNYVLHTNGSKIESKAFLITFANSAQYGNNACISPKADIQDGLLDICILSPFPKYGILDLGFKLFTKSINNSRYLNIIKTNELLLTREREGIIHLDGEPCQMGKELNIKLLPASLKVFIN